MAKTDWQLNDIVMPADMNQIGEEINQAAERLDDIEDAAHVAPIPITAGSQVVQGGNAPAIVQPRVEGRTLVNLVGDAGNCESLNGWGVTSGGATLALDAADKVIGNNSIKVTATATVADAAAMQTVAIDNSKYYLLVAALKNTSYSFLRVYALNPIWRSVIKESGAESLQGKWLTRYLKLSPADLMGQDGIMPAFGGGSSAAGQTFNADAIRMYEITEAEYDALDDMTADEIAAKYPFVGTGIHGVKNPTVRIGGKNLLHGQPVYPTGNNAQVGFLTPDSFTASWNAGFGVYYPDSADPVVVSPNTDYVLSFDFEPLQIDGSTQSQLAVNVDSMVDLNTLAAVNATSAGQYEVTFNSGPHTSVYLRIVRYNSGANPTGRARFSNIQLEVGNTATTYERPYSTQARALTTLRSTLDRKDELLYVDGRPKKLTRLGDVVLDGSLPWRHNSNINGFKRLLVSGYFPLGSAIGLAILTKYNGAVLPRISSSTQFADTDVYQFTTSGDSLFLWVANADSGWGPDYTPTADEIKAYFWGWRMYEAVSTGNTSRVGDYNGTGVKCWGKIGPGTNFGTIPGTGVLTVPTALNDQGYTSYQLQYELATPQIVDVYVEGQAVIERGDNYVTLSSEDVPAEAAEITYADTMYSALADGLRALAKPQAEKVVLFEGSVSSLGAAITLSESADNFRYLKIAYFVNGMRSAEFYHKLDPTVAIASPHIVGVSTTLQTYKLDLQLVNDCTIKINNNTRWQWDGSGGTPAVTTADIGIAVRQIIGVR